MVMGRSQSVTQDEFRSVYFNVPEVTENNRFCNNKIRTSLCAGPSLQCVCHLQKPCPVTGTCTWLELVACPIACATFLVRDRPHRYVRGWATPLIFLVQGILIEEFSKLANAYFAVRPMCTSNGRARAYGPKRPTHLIFYPYGDRVVGFLFFGFRVGAVGLQRRIIANAAKRGRAERDSG